MTKLMLIGDVHGKWVDYEQIITFQKPERSVQVGDFGIGFPYPRNERQRDRAWASGNHKFIRGNHDDPAACKLMPAYIPDMTYESDIEAFYVGGAFSIDKVTACRTEGIDWWPDEELSYQELGMAITMFADLKPRIMITHEAPESVVGNMFDFYKQEWPSITRQGFQGMFELHQPEYWVFGHWHQSANIELNGTKFICL